MNELQSAVKRAVKKKYPSIEVSDKKKKASDYALHLVIKRAGFDYEEDEDEEGSFIPIEDMSDDKLMAWREIVESLDTPLAKVMLEQVDEEIHRRMDKKVGEL